MLRRGAVFLGALAALALSSPGTPDRRALNLGVDVGLGEDGLELDIDPPDRRALEVGADVDLDEDGLDVSVDLALGHPRTVTVTETTTQTLPGDTVTSTETVTETEDPETITEIVTEDGETITETVTEDGETVTETVTGDGETITETVTEAAETITETETEAAETITATVTEAAETETVTEAAETVTESLPAITITETIETVVTVVETPPVDTPPADTPPITAPGPGETVTNEAPTLTITEVSACPAPTNEGPAAGAAPLDPLSDLTWGCKPGFICNPPKEGGCNFWMGVPASNYVCAPEECVEASPYHRVDWGENETEWYPPTEGYYYLDPYAFGLSYDIFEPPEKVVETIHGKETTILTGNYASQTDLTHYPLPSSSPAESEHERRGARVIRTLARRDDSVLPAVCFADCTNAMSETQKTGKSDELCKAGSPYLDMLDGCTACVAKYGPETPSSGRRYLDDSFEQFETFCEGSDTEPAQDGGDDDDGPESQVEEGEVSTRSQAGGNTQTEAEPITSTGAAGGEDGNTDAGETEGSDETAAPSSTPTSGSGGDSDDTSDDDSNDDSGSSNDGAGSDSTGADDDGSSGASGGSGGESTPDGTADDSPDSSSTHQTVPEGAAALLLPRLASIFLPLLSGLFFLL